MTSRIQTRAGLRYDLTALGIREGDGLFDHPSMKAVGFVVGGPRTIIESLQAAAGEAGLIGMPGFSTDAYFPP
ncbi:MAG: AAC(3) family N-acetyltransferase, partial [Pseudomonadota bacterium]